MTPFWEAVGYTPSPAQERVHKALLPSAYGVVPETGEQGEMPRVVVVGGGVQGGKSKLAGMHCFGRAIQPKGWADKLIWLVGVEYKDCKQEYDYIVQAGVDLKALKEGDYGASRDGPWEARFPLTGCVVKTLTSSDVTNLSREAPDGIVMCEPGRQTEDAFETMRQRASLPDTPGWLLVCGTFEDSARWYPHLYNEGLGDNPYKVQSFSIPTYSNARRYPRGEDDPRFQVLIRSTRDQHPIDGEDIVMERFYGVPRPTHGMVFWEFSRQIHVKDYAEYIPGIEVSLGVDPGYGHNFAVLFIQVVQGQVRIFDEIYTNQTNGRAIPAEIKTHRCYRDLNHIVMDVASDQHTNAQDSAYETWMSDFSPDDITISGRYVKVEEGIRRTHDRLDIDRRTGQSHTVINPRCKMLIHEMTEGYRYQVRSDTHEITSEKPIDLHNDACKAYAYWIVDRYGYRDGPAVRPPKATVTVPAYDRAYHARRAHYAGSAR